MTLNESIGNLLKGQVGTLTLGMNPEGKVWGVAQHVVAMGNEATMEITHKAQSTSVLDTVTQIIKQYNQAEAHRQLVVAAQKSKILRP